MSRLELKKPIRVICIYSKTSTKLIKGVTYFANSLYVPYSSSSKRVSLDNLGCYDANYFITVNGNNVNDEPEFHIVRDINNLKKHIDYTGQYVRCKWSSGKSLKENEIYYVINERITTHNGKWTERKLKLRGVRNYTSDYRFEELTNKEQRSIKLKNIIGKKPKTGEQTRKFLLYTKKEKYRIIIEILLKIFNDIKSIETPNKIELVNLFIVKGKKFDIKEEDILPFKDILNTLIEPYNDLLVFKSL